MPRLFIRLLTPAVATDEGFSVHSAWMIQEDDGSVRARGETDFRGLSDLIDPDTDWLQQPGNIVVMVPSEDVLSLSVEVPGRSVGQIRRALPFVVEEYVTTDIESMHLAAGELRRGEPTRVNLIERSLLESWLACLAALGIRPGHLYSEAELLPVSAGQASLLLDGDRVLIRTPDQAAALDRENLRLAADGAAAQVERLVVVFGRLTDMERAELAQELEVESADDVAIETPLEYFANAWRSSGAINLLQGEFRARQPVNPLWQRWRSVAALAGVWVVVALLAMTAEAFYASYRADALQAQAAALYRDIFPQERRVTSVRRQLQAKLGERPDDGAPGFMDLVGALAAVSGPSTRIQSLSYTDERNELAVDLMTGGFEAVDQLKERLAGQGIAVEITSAEQMDQGVRARVRLRG